MAAQMRSAKGTLVHRLGLWLLLACVGNAHAAPFSSIYFFGDSLTDSGNVDALTFGVYPPAPYYDGRFSNGPVWAEEFAALKGFPQAGQPAGMTLGPSFGWGSLSGPGNNYAIGGALTSIGGAMDSLGVPTGMLIQTYFYLSQVNYAADPNALYVFFGGGNDIRAAADLPEAQRLEAAQTAAFYEAYSLYVLGSYGARRFAVLNLPDIGLTPESRLVKNNSAAATQATLAFNVTLQELVNNVIQFPNQEMFFLDVYSYFGAIYQDALNGGTYTGLTNATIPCFAGYAGSPGADCSTSIFADDIHPTAAVHSLLANGASSVIHNPEPGTWLTMLSGVGLLVWRKRLRS